MAIDESIRKNIEKAMGIHSEESLALDGELNVIDRYYDGDHNSVYHPATATKEYKELARKATTNCLPLVVGSQSQSLSVQGYRTDSGEDSSAWQIWQRNDMDALQNQIHHEAVKYGQVFGMVEKEKADLVTPENVKIKAFSPREMVALYADPVYDIFPIYAVRVLSGQLVDYIDETGIARYEKSKTVEGKDEWALKSYRQHGVKYNGDKVCPVVRFPYKMDLQGRTTGVVKPLIPIQDSINQTVFDLLIAESFSSFKIRYITGMEAEPLLDENGEVKLDSNGDVISKQPEVGAGRMWFLSEDAVPGTLDETDLTPILAVVEARIKHLAALSQVPPHYLLGQLINLAAEALASAENSLMRLVMIIQSSFGNAYEKLLRLASEAAGLELEDDAEIVWADRSSKSPGAVADAFNKYIAGGIPKEIASRQIPWMTEQLYQECVKVWEKQDSLVQAAQSAANKINSASLALKSGDSNGQQSTVS